MWLASLGRECRCARLGLKIRFQRGSSRLANERAVACALGPLGFEATGMFMRKIKEVENGVDTLDNRAENWWGVHERTEPLFPVLDILGERGWCVCTAEREMSLHQVASGLEPIQRKDGVRLEERCTPGTFGCSRICVRAGGFGQQRVFSQCRRHQPRCKVGK